MESRGKYLAGVVEATPDIVAYSLHLLRQLEDTHSPEDFLLLADGPRVRVHESAPGTVKRSEDSGLIVDCTYNATFIIQPTRGVEELMYLPLTSSTPLAASALVRRWFGSRVKARMA